MKTLVLATQNAYKVKEIAKKNIEDIKNSNRRDFRF